MHVRGLAALLALCGTAPVAQDRAVFDPTGVLAFDVDGARHELRFPDLAWPRAGEHRLGSGGLEFGRVADGGFEPVGAGTLRVARFDATGVDLAIRWDGGELDVACPVELRRIETPVVRGQPGELFFVAPTAPASGDFVICAIGSAGTGLPGQRRVAESIGLVARTEGLDAVLLLGDTFPTAGVADATDPVFRERFDAVYPEPELPASFHLVLGDVEHRASFRPVVDFVATRPRLHFPSEAYTFGHDVGAVRAEFVGLDTTKALASVADPVSRLVRSAVPRAFAGPSKGWRVVFGHHPLHSHADDAVPDEMSPLRQRLGLPMKDAGVDVYVSGGTHALELLAPEDGVLCVCAGGGGGPEVARSVTWADDTRFAATGGGSVWLRFRPELLEIVFRDADGELLFAHHVAKRR